MKGHLFRESSKMPAREREGGGGGSEEEHMSEGQTWRDGGWLQGSKRQ